MVVRQVTPLCPSNSQTHISNSVTRYRELKWQSRESRELPGLLWEITGWAKNQEKFWKKVVVR